MASTMFDTIMARMDAGTLDDQTPAPAARVAPTGSDVVQGATSGLGMTVQGAGAIGEALSGGSVGSGLGSSNQSASMRKGDFLRLSVASRIAGHRLSSSLSAICPYSLYRSPKCL